MISITGIAEESLPKSTANRGKAARRAKYHKAGGKRRRFWGPMWPSIGLDYNEQRRLRVVQSMKTCAKQDDIRELQLQVDEWYELVGKLLRNGKESAPQNNDRGLGAVPLGKETTP